MGWKRFTRKPGRVRMPKRDRNGLESKVDSRSKNDIHNTLAPIHEHILTVLANGDVEVAQRLTDWVAYNYLHSGRIRIEECTESRGVAV